jgi:hypothetical protein
MSKSCVTLKAGECSAKLTAFLSVSGGAAFRKHVAVQGFFEACMTRTHRQHACIIQATEAYLAPVISCEHRVIELAVPAGEIILCQGMLTGAGA